MPNITGFPPRLSQPECERVLGFVTLLREDGVARRGARAADESTYQDYVASYQEWLRLTTSEMGSNRDTGAVLNTLPAPTTDEALTLAGPDWRGKYAIIQNWFDRSIAVLDRTSLRYRSYLAAMIREKEALPG